jgi:hypothetical protein
VGIPRARWVNSNCQSIHLQERDGWTVPRWLGSGSEKWLWGHIRRSGEFAYKPLFDMAYEFFEGYAAVTVGKRQGYIDPTGEIAVPATYLYAREFSEGLKDWQRLTQEQGNRTTRWQQLVKLGSSTEKASSRYHPDSSLQEHFAEAYVLSKLKRKSHI